MRQYAHGAGCLMAYLQTTLDDPSPAPCGRCSVCTGCTPQPGAAPTQEKWLAAQHFFRGLDVEIEVRKRWPAGVGRKGLVHGFDAGRAVAFADDPGWQAELQAWRRAAPGALPDEWLAGAVATLGRWSRTWSARPVCVVPLPAVDMADNRQLAGHIARRGRLPVLDVFTWSGGPAPDDVASTPMVAHLESSIELADANWPDGPVLLVASQVRTRWAATVAAALLRERGVAQVLLLALHVQP